MENNINNINNVNNMNNTNNDTNWEKMSSSEMTLRTMEKCGVSWGDIFNSESDPEYYG